MWCTARAFIRNSIPINGRTTYLTRWDCPRWSRIISSDSRTFHLWPKYNIKQLNKTPLSLIHHYKWPYDIRFMIMLFTTILHVMSRESMTITIAFWHLLKTLQIIYANRNEKNMKTSYVRSCIIACKCSIVVVSDVRAVLPIKQPNQS